MTDLNSIVARLTARNSARSEADVQSDLKHLLLSAPLNLAEDNLDVRLEPHVGGRRRIDIEVGLTVIEVKKDLRIGNVRSDAVVQLAGYVESRQAKYGCRYVGVLTDGVDWACYQLAGGVLHQVSELGLRGDAADVERLLSWLEGVLATTRDVKPTPDMIRQRLGAQSSAYQLDRATLASLYKANHQVPEVKTKRLLWSKLLSSALGTQFEDSDDLFVEHTLLVNSAEIIAHAVIGFDVQHIAARVLLGGEQFDDSQVYGVVERDFFDWACEVSGGEEFVRALARRLSRFDWSDVEHDVLKVLYESVITPETRKKLGEYYTPDWLAHQVVETVVTDPLDQRILDPSCGSGTFLFHAIRRYLDAAKRRRWKTKDTLDRLTRSVIGMDLHPVAVTLARVTYLLAIGRGRLAEGRGAIRVPVFLGDSMQWRKQKKDLLNEHELRIVADDDRELVPPEFCFPLDLLKDPQRFDALVNELAELSASRATSAVPAITTLLSRHGVRKDFYGMITSTFAVMCRLHDEGRDHVWGYYIRNLARPEWLSQDDNKVDTLIGNPPWLAFRHMPGDMQTNFREMCAARGLWHGAKVATHQDLSALFVVRAIELYLTQGGRFGFVMPSSVIDQNRQHYKGFRSARFSRDGLELHCVFDQPWDLKRLRPHFFPITASVVFGARQDLPQAMPDAETWRGRLPNAHGSWDEVEGAILRSTTPSATTAGASSPYAARFRQGATIMPRFLFMVERKKAGPLGHARGLASVRSMRSAGEKAPWKDLPSHEGVVESIFVRPTYLGECVLHYRTRPALNAVIPRDKKGIMDGATPRLDQYPELAKWWRSAEAVWLGNRSSDRLALVDRLNFHGGLDSQFPAPAIRVVYGTSGMHVVAAKIEDERAIIDHSLYWASAASDDEALYLCAILNSAATTRAVRPLMAFGKDERHIHKFVWKLPIAEYDPVDPTHQRLVELARKVEEVAASVEIPDGLHFATARRRIRDRLASSPEAMEIEMTVAPILGVARIW